MHSTVEVVVREKWGLLERNQQGRSGEGTAQEEVVAMLCGEAIA